MATTTRRTAKQKLKAKEAGSEAPNPVPVKVKTVRHVLELGVDAGNITVCDFAYLVEHGADTSRRRGFALLSVPPGRCAVSVEIPGTAYGRIRKKLTLDVTSGRLFVGDAAYAFSSRWDEFLNRTNYLLEKSPRFRSFDTGADGMYRVTITAPRRDSAD